MVISITELICISGAGLEAGLEAGLAPASEMGVLGERECRVPSAWLVGPCR